MNPYESPQTGEPLIAELIDDDHVLQLTLADKLVLGSFGGWSMLVLPVIAATLNDRFGVLFVSLCGTAGTAMVMFTLGVFSASKKETP